MTINDYVKFVEWVKNAGDLPHVDRLNLSLFHGLKCVLDKAILRQESLLNKDRRERVSDKG